jgi:hypothetical protein
MKGKMISLSFLLPIHNQEDLKTLMMVASKARIMSAPVVEKEDKIYTMEQFLEVL